MSSLAQDPKFLQSEYPKTLTLEIPANPNSDDPPQSESEDATSTPTPTTGRRFVGGGGGGARKRKNKRGTGVQVKKNQQKLELLLKTFNPIPFVPEKSLDFASHEALLKRLGLWDFVHLQFDVNCLRTDLIAQLIANFSPQNRCSYVNDVRIKINRADLARALMLPVKREKETGEGNESKESIEFIEQFVYTWLLLHEDAVVMADEVVATTGLIKEGNFEKVDWARLVWIMVEKELASAPSLGDCYYASHLQLLMKSQKADLFGVSEVADKMETEDAKEEDEEEEDVKMSEDVLEEVDELKVHEGVEELKAHEGVPEVKVHEGVEKLKVDEGVESSKVDEGVEELKVDGVNEMRIREGAEELKIGDGAEELKIGDGAEELKVRDGAEELKVRDGAEELKIGDGAEELEVREGVEELEKRDISVPEEHKIQLCLGALENVVKDVDNYDGEKEEEVVGDGDIMDFEESKNDEVPEQWQKSSIDGFSLQRCNLGVVEGMECEVEEKQEEEVEGEGGEEEEEKDEEDVGEDEEEEEKDGDDDGEDDEEDEDMGFNMLPKGDDLEGLNSENLIAAMEASQLPFSSEVRMRDNVSSGDFLASKVVNHAIPGSSSLFNNGNGNKRDIEQLENDMHRHSFNGANKRLRTSDAHWDMKSQPSEAEVCFQQVHNLLGKTKMFYDEKEHACQELTMHNQYLMNEMQQRDNYIQHLEKAKVEEQQKSRLETYRLERELYMMGNLLEGYRKALKDTHKAFAAYRAKCPIPEEPIYKDTGLGGLVLSASELEKLRLKQEEEEGQKRLFIERKAKEFEAECIMKFEGYKHRAEVLLAKLPELEKEVNILKEDFQKRKVSEKPESTPTEEPITQDAI